MRAYRSLFLCLLAPASLFAQVQLCQPSNPALSFFGNFKPGLSPGCYVGVTFTSGETEGGDRTANYTQVSFDSTQIPPGGAYEVVLFGRFPNARYLSVQVMDEHQLVEKGRYTSSTSSYADSIVHDWEMQTEFAGQPNGNPFTLAVQGQTSFPAVAPWWVQTLTFGEAGTQTYKTSGCGNSGTDGPTNLDAFPKLDLTQRHGLEPLPALNVQFPAGSGFLFPQPNPTTGAADLGWEFYTTPGNPSAFAYGGGPAILPPYLPTVLQPGVPFPAHDGGPNHKGLIMFRAYDSLTPLLAGQSQVFAYLRDLSTGCPVQIASQKVIANGPAQIDVNQVNAHNCFSNSVLPSYCDHEWVNLNTRNPVQNSDVDFSAETELVFQPNGDATYLTGPLPVSMLSTIQQGSANPGFLLLRVVPTAFPTWPCASGLCSLQTPPGQPAARYESFTFQNSVVIDSTSLTSLGDMTPDIPGSPYAHVIVNVDPANTPNTTCTGSTLTIKGTKGSASISPFNCRYYIDLTQTSAAPLTNISVTLRQLMPTNYTGNPLQVPYRTNIHNTTAAPYFENNAGCNFMSDGTKMYGPTGLLFYPLSISKNPIDLSSMDPLPEPNCYLQWKSNPIYLPTASFCPTNPIRTCNYTQNPAVVPAIPNPLTVTSQSITACVNDGIGNLSTNPVPQDPATRAIVSYEAASTQPATPFTLCPGASCNGTSCTLKAGASTLACYNQNNHAIVGNWRWTPPGAGSCGSLWTVQVPNPFGGSGIYSLSLSLLNAGYDSSHVSEQGTFSTETNQ